MDKTKLIIIRDFCNQGKTTTMWLLLKALIERKADVKKLLDLNNNKELDPSMEMPPQGELKHIDFMAALEWHNKMIVIDSRGDYVRKPVDDVTWAKMEWDPDYMICAIQNREESSPKGNNIWNYFNRNLPNTKYERVCFWSEYAENAADALLVKQPTVEAIIKYMA